VELSSAAKTKGDIMRQLRSNFDSKNGWMWSAACAMLGFRFPDGTPNTGGNSHREAGGSVPG
jgi:hypothetical protein